MFVEFFRGWIVVELLQLTGASWMLFSDPEKLQKCFKANVPAELLHFVLLGNLNHLLLKLFLLFDHRHFSQLHTLNILYNFVSVLFFSVELTIFQQLTFCPFVLTQLCFSVISAFATVLFWVATNDRQFGQDEAKTKKKKRQNVNLRKFDVLMNSPEKVTETKKNK